MKPNQYLKRGLRLLGYDPVRDLRQQYAQLQASSPPLILVGMHRSGTSLLAQLLANCGVQMGIERSEATDESPFFRDINTTFLNRMGCSWRCIDWLPRGETLIEECAVAKERVERKVEKGTIGKHLSLEGAQHLLAHPSLRWGWKDPRNSLVLPLWHSIFPQATVIHIYRDGRDVALSLLVRDLGRLGKDLEAASPWHVDRFAADIRLWEQYIESIRAFIDRFPIHHTLKYEELLARPEPVMQELLDAIGLRSQKSLAEVTAVIDPLRAGRSEKKPPAWLAASDINSPLLIELGYR